MAIGVPGTHGGAARSDGAGFTAEVTVAERDPLDPLDGSVRREIARRLLGGAGFQVSQAEASVRAADPDAIAGIRLAESDRA